MGGSEGRLESKGVGSWFQARERSGWGFATMSKTSVFQVLRKCVFLPPLVQGVMPRIIDYVSYKYQDRIFVCRLKINHAYPSCCPHPLTLPFTLLYLHLYNARTLFANNWYISPLVCTVITCPAYTAWPRRSGSRPPPAAGQSHAPPGRSGKPAC